VHLADFIVSFIEFRIFDPLKFAAMIRLMLTHVLLIIATTAFAQAKTPDLGELLLRLQKSSSDTGRIQALQEMGRYYLDRAGLNKNDLDSALLLFSQAMLLSRQTHHPAEEITAFKNTAEAHLHQGKADQAERELQEVVAQYKTIGYKKLSSTYDLLAETSKYKTDLHNEFKYRMEAVNSMEESADTALADYYYSKLALVYSDLGMYPESVTWIKKAMKILQQRSRLEDFYGDLSLLIYDLITEGRPEEALVFLRNVRKEVPPINLAQKVDMNDMFGHCYKALKQYDKAESYYLEMMRVYNVTNFNKNFYTTNKQMVTDYIYYYETMSEFYVFTKQYQKAGPYLNKILLLPAGVVRPVTLSKFHQMQFLVDSASGNYITAIRHFELHKRINDSLYNATQSKQTSEFQVKYETGKKEQDLQALRSKGQLQEQQLQKSAQARNFTYAFAGVLMVLIGVGYSRYRLKQKSNSQLQEQQKEINSQYQALRKLNVTQEKLLIEKEYLVKEIHHRVKNNLQIVISLLNAQSDFLDHPSALHAIRESRERMQAIALIHQKLYQPDQNMSISMNSYIQEMITYLGNSFSNAESIHFQLEVEDIDLDVSQAVPLGLILNEAITNAVKYAFPKERKGTITIVLQKVSEEDILLKIADNGKGLPADFDLSGNNSLGIQLIRLFSEQLDGDLRFRNDGGVEISLIFRQHFVTETPPSFLYRKTTAEETIDG
jgi:two-component sensor histidine kinase